MTDSLLDPVLELLIHNEAIGAVAIGGSHGIGKADQFSDIDVFAYCEDSKLLAAVASSRLQVSASLAPDVLVVGPTLATNFGIKLMLAAKSHPWIEVFLNSPLTYCRLPMTRKRRFLDRKSEEFYAQHFAESDLMSHSCGSDVALLMDGVSYLRGLRKYTARHATSGVRYYVRKLQVLITSLRLDVEGVHAYDPVAVERHLEKVLAGEERKDELARAFRELDGYSFDELLHAFETAILAYIPSDVARERAQRILNSYL